jgi:ribA/ribD-fused uncharacterized protein
MPRCPKGTRRNKKTGECLSKPSSTQKMRCPKGSRKNTKTGECHKKIDQKSNKEPVQKMPERTVLQFHSKSALLKSSPLPDDALRRLSNFSEDPVSYDGHEYPSVEHAYQAQKYLYSNKPEIVSMFYTTGTLKTPAEAKSAGGKTGMKKHGAQLDMARWNNADADGIMRKLIDSKISKNPYIKSILETAKKNNIRFVHFSRMDMYWGAHVNADGSIKKGENKLGEIYNQFIDRV